jgi:hypothetical protein
LKEEIAKSLEGNIESELFSLESKMDDLSLTSLSNASFAVSELNFSDDEKYFSSGLPAKDDQKVPTVRDDTEATPEIPADIAEKLQGLNSCQIKFSSIEFTNQYKNTTSMWCDFKVPFVNYAERCQFREKLSPNNSLASLKLSHQSQYVLVKKDFIDLDRRFIFQFTGSIGKTAKNKLKEDIIWRSSAGISFLDIVLAPCHSWQGELILFAEGSKNSRKDIRPSDVIGYLQIEVSLGKKEDIQPSREVASPPVVAAPPNPPISAPVYFGLHLSTVRGLVFQSFNENSPNILLFLQMKLFNHGSKFSTSPVLWKPDFDMDTGQVNLPVSFDYKTAVPLAVTREFMDKYCEIPVIVEVHATRPSSFNQIHPEVPNSKSLLGIVRLPFHQAFTSYMGTVLVTDIVQVPELEYSIDNPITGKSVGWIKSRIAVGKWEAVNTFLQTNTSNVSIPEQTMEKDEAEHIAVSSTKEESVTSDSVSHKGNECTIQVTIHKACGLLGLLEEVIDIKSNQECFEALDFALQSGVNSFITLELFPSESKGDAVSEDAIQTHIVASSFVPNFDYSVELTIESLDTELLNWIKKDGCAIGKIWHRIPRHLAVSGCYNICLGTFEIPMKDLLTQRNGIQNEWFPCGPSYQGSVCCSISFHPGFELSGSGPETILNNSLVIASLSVSNCNIQVPDEAFSYDSLVIRWKPENWSDEDWIQSDSLQPLIELPGQYHWNQEYIEEYKFQSSELSAEKIEVQFHVTGPMECYIGSCFLKISKLLTCARAFRRSGNTRLGQPILNSRVQIINYESPNIGFSFADIKLELKIVSKNNEAKLSSRKSKAMMREEVKKPNTQLTNQLIASRPLSDCQDLSEIHLSRSEIDDSLLKLDELGFGAKTIPDMEKHELEKPNQHSIVSKTAQMDSILVKIEVERATQLPLADDPLAKSLTSPFVRGNETKTTPPNSCVSIRVPNGFFEADQMIWSDIVPSSTSPIWKFETEIHLNNNPNSILEMKNAGSLVFQVWDFQEVGIDFMSNSRSNVKKNLIGSCNVNLDPLYSGFADINGWYPIKNTMGIGQGQLLVKICPEDDLSILYQQFRNSATGNSLENNHAIGGMTSSMHAETIALKSRSSLKPLKSQTQHVLANQETWIWNGTEWEHKRIIPSQEKPYQEERVSQEYETVPMRKSIAETIGNLDALKKDMLSKLQMIEITNSLMEKRGNLSSSTSSHNSAPDVEPESAIISEVADLSQESEANITNPFLDSFTHSVKAIPTEDLLEPNHLNTTSPDTSQRFFTDEQDNTNIIAREQDAGKPPLPIQSQNFASRLKKLDEPTLPNISPAWERMETQLNGISDETKGSLLRLFTNSN